MAQIGSTLQSHGLHVYQMNRVGFRCRSTLMNPAMSCFSSSSTSQPMKSTSEKTRTHLSNLEKLLQINEVSAQPIRPVELEPATTSTTGTMLQQPVDGGGGRRLLEKLNLTGIWPEGILGRAAEVAAEMSPHRLTRLQRLLSSQPEYSPRNQLGSRWREYHGSRDWAGLLDPLDENLRREVVRYGEFIQAAYQSFHADPATTKEGVSAWRDVDLPDKSYKVTKSLYATSSIGLPKWVDDVAPDLGWMTQRSSMIGYVAVCTDEREIARMGRRDIVIALRGTSTCLEWAENVRESLVPMQNDDINSEAKVECGFNSLFRTKGEHVPSLADSVVQEIQRLMSTYKGETLSISITGHSLGAALALLVGNEINTRITNPPPVAVFSFGGPRVGNRAFANLINSNNVKVLRIVNKHDLITRVPGMFLTEETEQHLKLSNPHVAGALHWLDNMPWSYSHVGTELKVDTRTSPYLKPDADVACNHDLEAYLHLVDGFLATNCPFRPNAKRSLLKLLSEQGANVKKLYRSKSKAKSLTLKIESGGIVSSMSLSSNSMLSPSLQHE